MSPKGAPNSDREIARLASGQHGVVLLAQRVAVGVTPRAVSRRVESGRLHRMHRGVYAVGHPLPAPEVNVRVGRFLVDFLWRDRRLIVEADGYRFHRGRSAFEGGRERDVELKLRGYEVVRFTHRQVVEDPHRVAHTVRALLG